MRAKLSLLENIFQKRFVLKCLDDYKGQKGSSFLAGLVRGNKNEKEFPVSIKMVGETPLNYFPYRDVISVTVKELGE